MGSWQWAVATRQVIKKVTDDPEAPQSAKETKDKAIDLLWPEVEKAPLKHCGAANHWWLVAIGYDSKIP